MFYFLVSFEQKLQEIRCVIDDDDDVDEHDDYDYGVAAADDDDNDGNDCDGCEYADDGHIVMIHAD